MYHHATFCPLSRLRFFVVCAVLLVGVVKMGYGQGPMERVYATSQTIGGTPLLSFVTSPGNAVDQEPTTYSTIGITVAGNVWQQLQFPTSLPAGTTVRVKIGTAGNILSLLGDITIQAYQNNTSVGASTQLSSLISLIAGEDQAEIVFTPSSSFNAVRVGSSGVALGGGLKIYEAYYLKPANDIINCDVPADLLYGSTGGIAGGLNAIDNPYHAIDADHTSFAMLRANVQAAGSKTHLTALYNTSSQTGDSARIVLRSPNGLLNANLLSNNIRIRTLLDNNDNGNLLLDPEILSLTLLSPGSTIQILTYPVITPFNRIEVSLGGGLLDALSSLEVYEIQRIPARPEITAPNLANNEVNVCEGESIILSIVSPQVGAEYRWYDQPTGGIPVIGNSYQVSSAVHGNDYTLYVAKARIGCTEESNRTEVVVKVIPSPGHPELTITDIPD